jgi:hypothetical protein
MREPPRQNGLMGPSVSAATPKGEGRLDDVVQLFDSEGPWAANQATIAPPLEQNQRFRLKTTRFGGGTEGGGRH